MVSQTHYVNEYGILDKGEELVHFHPLHHRILLLLAHPELYNVGHVFLGQMNHGECNHHVLHRKVQLVMCPALGLYALTQYGFPEVKQ